MGKNHYFKHRKYQKLCTNNKLESVKNAMFCVFFHICRKKMILISQGSALTKLP